MLELGEYRESVDLDMLCADRVGYSAIRSEDNQNSFGRLFKGEYKLTRDIRTDRYGIRTWLQRPSDCVDLIKMHSACIEHGHVRLIAVDTG